MVNLTITWNVGRINRHTIRKKNLCVKFLGITKVSAMATNATKQLETSLTIQRSS
jgi:hypothetical protein